MILRGIPFGPVWAASGVQGFFTEREYWHYRLYNRFVPGFTFDGVTFVSKTSPVDKNVGNMPLDERFEPKERLPACIKAAWRQGIMMNKVGLSSPGFETLVTQDKWQERTEPFQVSYMPIAGTPNKRLMETRRFVRVLKRELSGFRTQIGLQYNPVCPNTGHSAQAMLEEVPAHLDELNELGVPLIVKLNILVPIPVSCEIATHLACDALVVSNTLPFGELRQKIDWGRLFPKGSPFPQFGGGGGLSGKPLFPLVEDWVIRATRAGIEKPISFCGGIFHRRHVLKAKIAGASGISFATVASLRPWRLKSIIETAHQLWPA